MGCEVPLHSVNEWRHDAQQTAKHPELTRLWTLCPFSLQINNGPQNSFPDQQVTTRFLFGITSIYFFIPISFR